MVTQLTDTDFDAFINAETPAIVDFWAEWCGPCKLMAPVFEKLAGEYEGTLRFAKLDTEAHPEIASRLGIQGIPSLSVFKNGEEVERIVGFAPEPVLKEKIDAVLAKVNA